MTYDYLTINFAAATGILFLLIFLSANASLSIKIKKTFYMLIIIEIIEMITYSLELYTTTFAHLSPSRLWLSAIGYSIRPFIFCLILSLAMRNYSEDKFPKFLLLPALLNILSSFSVFFTDLVYSYTPDNLFQRGPLGYCTHSVTLLYLIILIFVVFKAHKGKTKLETLIIFAIAVLIIFSMVMEALYSIRTLGRTAIVMTTIFYYMFFQTKIYKSSLTEEQEIRLKLEHSNRIDGVTNLLNKKAFTEAVQHTLDQAHTMPFSSIAFIFLDLDHLKTLNDTLGHSLGDVAIMDAADILKKIFRKTDLIGRFGGDEFCIFLTDIPKERFQSCLSDTQHKLRNVYTDKNISVNISASIGAVYTEQASGFSYEQLIQLADEALYEAKASGRNCHILKEL